MIVKMLDILSLVKNVVAFKPRFRVRKSDIKTKKDRYRTSRHFDEKNSCSISCFGYSQTCI